MEFFRENKDNTHCLFLLCCVRKHVQSPVQCFFSLVEISWKICFATFTKKITNLVDFFPNASVESNNFTKITCGFFLVYLPNFLVGHLYIFLNKKCSQETGECVFPNSRYYILPNSHKKETRFFWSFLRTVFRDTRDLFNLLCSRGGL